MADDGSPRGSLSWLLVVLAALAVVRAARASVLSALPARMSDALPPYLYGVAWLEGLNPLDPGALASAYALRGMKVGAATWSTLYPATIAPVMAPLSTLPWERFSELWGWILLISCGAVGVVVPAARPRGPIRDRAIRGVGLLLMALYPATAEIARLGQVNALLAALCALALVALARRWDLIAGVLIGLGACIKLVPALLLLPVVLAGRWRALIGAAAVGLPVLALTLEAVSLGQLLEGVRGSSGFQDAMRAPWLSAPDIPGWAEHLGFARHRALLLLSALLAGGATLWRPDRGVLVGAGALLLAWLGTDSAGFHMLYTPLFAPALVWAVTWALEEGAPRVSWLLSPALAIAALGMPSLTLWGTHDNTAACTLLGWMVWAVTLARLGWELRRAEARGPLAAALEGWPRVSAGALGVAASVLLLGVGAPRSFVPPEGAWVDDAGTIQGSTPGLVSPGEARPGEDQPAGPSHLAAGPEGLPPGTQPVSERADARTRAAFEAHAREAPPLWMAVAEALPGHPMARGADHLARAAPPPDADAAGFVEAVRWMVLEGLLIDALQTRSPTPTLAALKRSWDQVITKGPPGSP